VETGLYVVATPIGNLADITQRALEVLRAADVIAAEDTRHSARLLEHFGIDSTLIPYHDHSDERAVARIVGRLAEGGVVALISDAGTPLISDPGYRVVREVQDAGYRVFPIPGPSAVIAALSSAGLPTDRFLFEGFLPAKQGARSRRLGELQQEAATLVFYEAPHRLLDTLHDMVAAFGAEREAVLARELTKTFETLQRAPLEQLAAFVAGDNNQPRGEVVLLVSGARQREQSVSPEVLELLLLLGKELPPKKAAGIVAQWSGLRKSELYDLLLAHR
jgi:16S rRNA (cytidine1402-2'-O)-methyltransferase